ncbi:hypothetical protein [Streptomyces sp. AN091965]|uniref:hypothetical protein n=1 Tax=Streptomyces sp. AN091965 TaxID=2927803 RepID=UPI001F615A33|nr:hypothetical protein [Streptomyces sp. AN091965]MCI3929969.1 hypothetical protein [Streptomyces sp. AN091965]
MMAPDLPPLEQRADNAYLMYLDHLRVCPRCGLSWKGRRCPAGLFLKGNLRAARTAARLYERGRKS